MKPDQIAKYTRDGKLKGKLTKRQGRPDRYVYYFKDVNNFIKLYEPRKKAFLNHLKRDNILLLKAVEERNTKRFNTLIKEIRDEGLRAIENKGVSEYDNDK